MKSRIKRGKTGGRKKGTPNKSTRLEREFLQTLLDAQTHKIKSELSLLHGEGYLKVIFSLMDYILPKLQKIELPKESSGEEEESFVILSDGTKIPF